MNLKIRPAGNQDINRIVKILTDNHLPVEDIAEEKVQLFAGVIDDRIVASIGLEDHEKYGLLRSLAVDSDYKNRKIGDKLIKYLLDYVKIKGINALYLLTTTADKYFEKQGFCRLCRMQVPDRIKQTKQFKDICPDSAIVMFKETTSDQ